MSFKLSAGVYFQEYVKGSGIFNPISMTVGAACFASKKGPLGPTLITGGYEEFVQRYGNGDMQWSQAHLALKPALKEMKTFYGNRVVNEAKYAGLSLFYDESNGNFFANTWKSGSDSAYDLGGRETALVTFSDEIPTDGTVKFDLGSTSLTQAFNTTSNYTLSLLATQIQNELDSLGDGGEAQVIKAWNLSDRKEEIVLNFARDFQMDDKFNAKIKGNHLTKEIAVSVSYTTDSAAMVQAIIDAINTEPKVVANLLPSVYPSIRIACVDAGPTNLNVTLEDTSAGDYGFEWNVLREGHGVYDDRSILITFPNDVQAPELGGTVESDTKSVTVDISESSKVMDIFAENPGEWASSSEEGLGIKITGLDLGIQQRNRITISQAIEADNEFTMTLGLGDNSWAIGPVPFNTSSDQTLKDIASAIQAKMDEVIGTGGSASVEEVKGGIDNDRTILVISPKAGQTIELNDALFSGGNTQPIATIKEVIPTTPSSETFNLEVYNRQSISVPVEFWSTSLKAQLDGNGQQLEITKRVNEGAYKSYNIRVIAYTTDFSKLKALDSIAWLGGGDDGYLPTNAQIVSAWDDFADPEKITVRILMNAGYANPDVHQKMASIAQKRRDCVALLDMPSDSQTTEAAMNYRQYEMNVNTCYAALYSPDILVFDEVTGNDVYIGPSGFAAAQICYTERTKAIWWAAAGLNRGKCDGAKGVRVIYGEGDRDLLEPLQINPVRDMKSNGIVIFGEYTTQTNKDPLSDLHVRLLCNNIEIAFTDSFAYSLFDPNDEYLRSTLAKEATDFLKPIKDGRGLRDYRVVSDINRENAADVDAGAADINIYIKPVSSTKYIRVKNYILGSGVEFDEVIENGV